MGIQTMGSQLNGQQSHLQPASLIRQNSWYGLTLDEVKNQLGEMGKPKPVGSMNLDELLHSIWAAEANQPMGMENESSSSVSSLQHQASFTLARALSGKTVDDVWREIQQGQKKRNRGDSRCHDSETSLGDMTLENFLIQAGIYAEPSPTPNMALDVIDTTAHQNSSQNMGSLSSYPSLGVLSDTTTPKRRRDPADTHENTMERRLKRKIKNRESAARSRARKQAYHDELVNKVSRLEEENVKLKKEKEFENATQSKPISEPKYQLRRTSSASF